MKIGVIGLGGAAQRGHLPALQRLRQEGLLDVLIGCDPDPVARERSGSLLDASYVSAEEMTGDVLVDRVVLATPPSEHAGLESALREQSFDVICEKPVGFAPGTYEMFRRLAAAGPNRAFALVNQYRCAAGWQTILDWFSHSETNAEAVQMSVRVERPAPDPLANTGWRAFPEMGGLIADHGSHFVALARSVAPLDEVVTAVRDFDVHQHERAALRLQLEGGCLEMQMAYGTKTRSTCLSICQGGRSAVWVDSHLQLTHGRRRCHLVVAPLSDRGVVDGLYVTWYRETLGALLSADRRNELCTELLDVGRIMRDLRDLLSVT